jgi:hypothetical protein
LFFTHAIAWSRRFLGNAHYLGLNGASFEIALGIRDSKLMGIV